MSTDNLALLVRRAMTDREFVRRAQADLDATLTAEGIQLNPAELEAVRDFQREVAGLSPDQVEKRLTDASRRQQVF